MQEVRREVRVRYRPGERWVSRDRREEAVVTNVYRVSERHVDSPVRVRFLYIPRVGSSATAELDQSDFRRRFPIRGDGSPSIT